MKGLTPKQKAFADEYLICGNATEAAKKAGYKEKAAYATGAENLRKPQIISYIAERQKQIEDARIAGVAEVMIYLTSVMRGEIKDQFDLDAPLSERTKAAQEILKRNVENKKMEIELLKIESQIKNRTPEEDAEDNFLEALNASAREVWDESE